MKRADVPDDVIHAIVNALQVAGPLVQRAMVTAKQQQADTKAALEALEVARAALYRYRRDQADRSGQP